jgi:undecaprenyl-diphosphatase
MLDTLQIVVLSLVQGITEFLPISSSAHLILVPRVFHWPDQGLAFDIAMHLGTLLAVLLYFRKDIQKMSSAFIQSLMGKGFNADAKMAWAIGFATIPVGIAGLCFKDFIETSLRSPVVIAFSTIFFGILLWLADSLSRRIRDIQNLNWKDVLTIGCGQALSLIPGTSRSGVTLTSGLAMGLTRDSAARFAFLLSIPVILLAGGLQIINLIKEDAAVQWSAMGLGIGISAISGYICIHYFLKFLTTVGVLPFVIYRLCLGGVLLYLI